MELKVYINGKIINARDAAVSVFDRGLNYGDGVFETLKSEGGRVQFKKEHLARLIKNASAIGIKKPGFQRLLDDISSGAMERLLKRSRLMKDDAYIRITITRGIDFSGHQPAAGLKPTMIIVVKPLTGRALSEARSAGASASILKTPHGAMPSVKSLNFLQNILGKAEATGKGAYEGLFTSNNCITEGTASNIFIVRNKIIKTPPADGLILPGIMREAIIRLAKKNKLPIKEGAIPVKDLFGADEAFLTNSVIGIVPLVRISNKRIASGTPGEITKALQSALARPS